MSFDSPLFSKNNNEFGGGQNISSDSDNGGLKRTSSVGASKTFLSMMNNDNYTDNTNNTTNNNDIGTGNDFANSMKVGQSGLDLRSTGLRASSTNIRSKNQLSQLFRDSQVQLNNKFNSNNNQNDNSNGDANNKAFFSSGRGNDSVVGRSNSTINNNKTFSFNADSDSEDEEDGLSINKPLSNSKFYIWI
ncbi:unnamed protein product [[Candida] boidinii]|uniref:Unnamed protein product n=1 Tax=Candida boidinii TaxID=5477 RepID=A0ACB5UCN2_CANBO|nr:unnamed protein product [[Candida] boidinii]